MSEKHGKAARKNAKRQSNCVVQTPASNSTAAKQHTCMKSSFSRSAAAGTRDQAFAAASSSQHLTIDRLCSSSSSKIKPSPTLPHHNHSHPCTSPSTEAASPSPPRTSSPGAGAALQIAAAATIAAVATHSRPPAPARGAPKLTACCTHQ